LLDVREYRVYPGVKRNEIYRQVSEFWARQGFYVAQISPFELQGQSYESKIGLRREFYLRIDEQNENTYLDLTVRAQITDLGLIGGVAAAVIFWPAAVVGGALSYSSYKEDAKNLINTFWAYVDSITHKVGSPIPPPPYGIPTPQPPQTTMPPPLETTPCENCGALLPKNWKACPYCAKPKSQPKEEKGEIKEKKDDEKKDEEKTDAKKEEKK